MSKRKSKRRTKPRKGDYAENHQGRAKARHAKAKVRQAERELISVVLNLGVDRAAPRTMGVAT